MDAHAYFTAMTPKIPKASRPASLSLLIAAGLMAVAPLASAQAPDAVTMNLIKALVSSGVLTQAKADELLKDAQAGSTSAASAQAATAPNATSGNNGQSIRVPYVPQVVKDQIRQEVKEEVVAQARSERWGVPNATPEWVDRFKLDGDLRLRGQVDTYGKDNSPARDYAGAVNTGLIRAPDFAAVTAANGTPVGNTEDDRDRLRLRLRLGIMAKVADMASVGLRLSTGSDTDRVSTNQTLGQNFNKPHLLVDRAYIRLDPTPWLGMTGGRVPNPWFSTDLVWSENLNFEGVAVSAKWPFESPSPFQPFATVGAFPIREYSPPTKNGRWLYGAQIGLGWQPNAQTHLKVGLAQYMYKNLEGHVETDYSATTGAGPTYGHSEYEAGLRQKGNTLFAINSPLESGGYTPEKVKWGLASKFRPLALTLAADFAYFGPYSLMVSGEYVTNPAFDRQEIDRRTGYLLTDGDNKGYLLRAVFGSREVRSADDWQVALAYRYLGSDAVLDAFTDSDFGLGGTNHQGYSMAFTKGLDRNTSVGLRYLSTRSIDSPTSFLFSTDKFSTSTLQVDLNARF